MAKSKINVFGMGYMGYPLACLLAKGGYEVNGVDIDSNKIEKINSNHCLFEEKGLGEVFQSLSKNSLSGSTQPIPASVHIIAVPTPHRDGTCDLSYIESACEMLKDVVARNDLLIVESTIKPGVCEYLNTKYFKDANVLIAHCPERAIPGNTMFELVNNDRIVGGLSPEATKKAVEVYRSFVKGEIFETEARTAEAVKLLENTSRDIGIAMANEFEQILREKGIDASEAIYLANRHPRVNILNPGIGVGGHCIAVDPWFLAEDSQVAKLIRASRQINDERPTEIARRILRVVGDKKKIGILGVTYKPDIDDIRETPVKGVIEELKANGLNVAYFDPHYRGLFCTEGFDSFEKIEDWADILIQLVNHKEFQSLRSKKEIKNFKDL